MDFYWVSAIIQNECDKKPWLCAMSDSIIGLDKAKQQINFIRRNHNVLSAWIDIFDTNNNKQTVFHECYIDALGNTKRL